MEYRIMKEEDICKVVPLYIDYYNNHEESEWTEETTYKRIYQVLTREDSYCLILEDKNKTLRLLWGILNNMMIVLLII